MDLGRRIQIGTKRRYDLMVTPRLVIAVLVAVATTACASTGAVPRPFPLPGGPAASRTPPRTSGSPDSAASTTADGYSISSTALSLRGAPYRNGGVDPAGFDCSGLVKYVFEQHGVAMPREARQQFQVGQPVEPASLEPGDLVFFTTVAPGPSHVGILVGGDQFVHAPTTNGVVRVESLSSQYWSSRFIGAKRVN
jgi:cell wall-associated NlpC family hydrolase